MIYTKRDLGIDNLAQAKKSFKDIFAQKWKAVYELKLVAADLPKEKKVEAEAIIRKFEMGEISYVEAKMKISELAE